MSHAAFEVDCGGHIVYFSDNLAGFQKFPYEQPAELPIVVAKHK